MHSDSTVCNLTPTQSVMDTHREDRGCQEPLSCGSIGLKPEQLMETLNRKTLYRDMLDCVHCDYQTMRSGSLTKFSIQRHIRLHAEVKSYNCDQRDYQTKLKRNTIIHRNTHFEVEPAYKCDQCDYVSSTKSALNVHVSTHHKEKVEYQCDRCDFKTAWRNNLERHIRMHTGGKFLQM